jgi:hypothetical protein
MSHLKIRLLPGEILCRMAHFGTGTKALGPMGITMDLCERTHFLRLELK